ncbi:limbin-like [Lampris incognitus]|uniref:limbin-like n=1 Tax=Lampris incognitus TaxID=2546036 RepID=UPI0024B4A2D2|nr:limbin-like [Lampris incognitus]
MLQVLFLGKLVVTLSYVLFDLQLAYLSRPFPHRCWCRRCEVKCSVMSVGEIQHPARCQDGSGCVLPPTFLHQGLSSVLQHNRDGKPADLGFLRMTGAGEIYGTVVCTLEEGPISSGAPAGPWESSIYSSFAYMFNIIHHRGRRSTLTRYNPGRSLPQVQNVASPTAFRVEFQKCAEVELDTDPPQLTFFLQIYNMGPVGGTNLSQVAIRDSISGIVPLKTEGKVVETGYQTFAIDSLPAGSRHVVNYTARIKSHKNEVLHLPAFLTFSNASQNDVSMFGPLMANLTLRVNSTDRIHPNHGVHFAGFVGGFLLTLVLLSLGYLARNLMCARNRFNLPQQRKNRGDSDPEYADCNMIETAKDEAVFEDKMVDIMVLEDPQNMYQALENLEMSSLLRATANLEATRVQIYKDLITSLLGNLQSRDQASAQVQQRLLSVLHGQLLGMEGRLKEERGARMAALAGQCNLETREEMEVEHRSETAEKARAELLCQHADQQELLQCGVLLEKLHKLSQSRLQRSLLVRHEEASAKVQRHIVEWRRVELHKIFCEELEEATRMGELDKSTVKSLQHDYFMCQDQLEEVLDVVLANQRNELAERHAQRKFLVHSLQSLKSLMSDTFSNTSSNLDRWFNNIKRGSTLSTEHIDQLQDKAQKELLMVRQRLDEALSQERRAMHCVLVKKRRELISNMLQEQKQRQKDLSGLSRGLKEIVDMAQHLRCWQNLLTAQSLELAELINNLDEEAAANIRKTTMCTIQSAMAEVNAIQPSAVQAMLTLLPPGAPSTLFDIEPEPGPSQSQGQGASALQRAQERLHQEGKVAVRTLRCTREALREAMERELHEQRELRARGRAFFRCLCSFQLTLSEDDSLRMKLEFQKCLSVMDRCLVLPHAISRAKLYTTLAAWKKETEQLIDKTHIEKKPQSKGKSSKSRHKADTAELLLFQRRLEERIQLFEKEKEMESVFMDKVLEEMERERGHELCSQADGLAMQMAAIHYQKAERRAKVLETSKAMLTLHNLLTQQLRDGKSLEGQDMAQCIQSHCLGLEEANLQLHRERTGLDCFKTTQCGDKPITDPEDKEKEDVNGEEEEKHFQVQQDCRMAMILNNALYKRDQVLALLNESLQQSITMSQAMEDLRQQVELKRLYSNCDQDLEFASQLVKKSQMTTDDLVETLRLLLPTLPESELLSIIDALCPKQQSSSSSEQDHAGCSRGSSRTLLVKLREEMVKRNMPSHVVENRLQAKRQSLNEKLFPSLRPQAPKDVAPVLVKKKGMESSVTTVKQETHKSTVAESTAALQHQHATSQGVMEVVEEPLSAPITTSTSTSAALSPPDIEGRVFVFRVPPDVHDNIDAPSSRRRKKKNFLNLKKGSVAPTNLP